MSDRAALVVGVDGLIGAHVADRLSQTGCRVYGTTRCRTRVTATRLYLDLSDDVSKWPMPEGVDVAYLCAGVSSFDACQREPDQTWQINVSAVSTLADRLMAAGAFVVYPSTSAVFDGSAPSRRADEAASPQTEYGRQRAAVERMLLTRPGSAAVVRSTKILGHATPLIRRWMQALRRGEAIRPFSDAVMAPVPLAFTAQVLQRVAGSRLGGVWQVSGEQDLTYEQAARHIAKRLCARDDLVYPMNARDANIPREFLPRHTTLDTTRLRTELQTRVPDVWSTIDSVLLE